MGSGEGNRGVVSQVVERGASVGGKLIGTAGVISSNVLYPSWSIL